MPKIRKKDLLKIQIYSSRKEMGYHAAHDIEDSVCSAINKHGVCNIIFAAAPSQNEVLATLAASSKIDWKKVHAFHMDEYVGISPAASQSFAQFLRHALFEKVNPGIVEYLNCSAEPEAEAARYSALLKKYPADIVIMGIGENGHIAFNDPHAADFKDTSMVKIVTLDEKCRLQQVHDGCFSKLEDVPKTALTLTIPALTAPSQIFCIVPASTKAQAVLDTINGPVSELCPASVLRNHSNATLYLDSDSSSLITEEMYQNEDKMKTE